MADRAVNIYQRDRTQADWPVCPQCPFRKTPELPSPAISPRLLEKAREARRILDARLADPPTVRQLARCCMTNVFSIQEAFKACFGQTIKEYSLRRKLEQAKFLLLVSADSLSSIAFETGFHDASAFVKFFRARTGLTPGAYRSLGHHLNPSAPLDHQ